MQTDVTMPSDSTGVPFFGVPPLGLVTRATNVVQDGDVYTFTVPMMDLPFGWVAYAPLSGKHESLAEETFNSAHDTTMTAVIRNGMIVALSFPHGVRGGHIRSGRPELWTLAHFGTAPAVRLP
jgi:hypothetical protein